MTTIIQGNQLRNIAFGVHVTKEWDTTTGETTLFNITGGLVYVSFFVGEITVAFGANATNSKIVYDCTDAGPADLDLCIATATASLTIGTLLTLDGAVGSSLQFADGVAALTNAELPNQGWVFKAGAIHMNQTADQGVGHVTWHLCYIPISDNAAVAAA